MKKNYKPLPLINLPRWLETIIQGGGFLTSLYLIHLLKLDLLFKGGDIFNIANSKLLTVIFYLSIFFIIKVLGTFTAVDFIEIDYEENNIIFDYWLFYFNRKRLTIKFSDFSYKTGYDISIIGGSFYLKIYQKNKLKIKLNKRNGWKKDQIDDVYSRLKSIKKSLTS